MSRRKMIVHSRYNRFEYIRKKIKFWEVSRPPYPQSAETFDG